jgi:hypothetical protein
VIFELRQAFKQNGTHRAVEDSDTIGNGLLHQSEVLLPDLQK